MLRPPRRVPMSQPNTPVAPPQLGPQEVGRAPLPFKQRVLRELRSWLWTLALAWLVWMAVQSLRGGVTLPAQAPDFTAQTLSGQTVQLAALRGKPVVLYFFASWCPACKVTSPEIDRFAAAHPEVQVLGIAAEDAEEARAFMAKNPRTFAVIPETNAMDAAYKVRALPTTVVLDAAGQVVWSRQGVILPFELGWHMP